MHTWSSNVITWSTRSGWLQIQQYLRKNSGYKYKRKPWNITLIILKNHVIKKQILKFLITLQTQMKINNYWVLRKLLHYIGFLCSSVEERHNKRRSRVRFFSRGILRVLFEMYFRYFSKPPFCRRASRNTCSFAF